MNEAGFFGSRELAEREGERSDFHALSDRELEESLRDLLGSGARLEARIVAHLAEVEARRMHLRAGRSSMYEYCQKDLGLSDYEAFCRIAAARVAAKYPVVFGMLERRELSLTAIVEVRKFLTAESHRELLAEVAGKTKLQVREALARQFPRTDVPGKIRKLPGAENRAQSAIDPLSTDRYRLQLTISGELKRQLELAQELLSHANPHGDLAVVLERALPLLIAKLRNRRFGAKVARTRKSKKAPEAALSRARTKTGESAEETGAVLSKAKGENDAWLSTRSDGAHHEHGRRHIPANVRREVTARDGERCAFVNERGRRCECRAFLEIDHREPWAKQGRETTGNLRWMCRQHNRLLAEREFGKEHVAAAIERRRIKGGQPKRPRAA